MTSCEGNAGLKRLVSKKNERPAAAPRNAAPAGAAVFPVSAIALAVALFAAAPQIARAAGAECGSDGAGQDTRICSSATYENGITYTNSNGLTLNLVEPGTVVRGTGVALSTPIGPVGATLAVNVGNNTLIETVGTAVSVSHKGADGHAVVTINGGKLTSTSTASTVLVQGNAGNRTDALLIMNGGEVHNTDSGYGLNAIVSGVNSKTDAAIVINGGRSRRSAPLSTQVSRVSTKRGRRASR